MGDLVSRQFERGREDQPALRFLVLRDHIVLTGADSFGPTLSLNRKRAIFVDGKEGLILFQVRKDLLDGFHLHVVLGIAAGEYDLGLLPFESSRLDKGTYTVFRCAMTALDHNSVKIIHSPGCSVNPVSRRRRVKQRKQALLALWIIFRLGCLPRQQYIEAAPCK